MRCPACGEETMVIKTRLAGAGLVVRRRRACGCGHRFTTRETVVVEVAPVVPVVAPVAAALVVVKPVRQEVERSRARDDFNPFDDDSCFIPEC